VPNRARAVACVRWLLPLHKPSCVVVRLALTAREPWWKKAAGRCKLRHPASRRLAYCPFQALTQYKRASITPPSGRSACDPGRSLRPASPLPQSVIHRPKVLRHAAGAKHQSQTSRPDKSGNSLARWSMRARTAGGRPRRVVKTIWTMPSLLRQSRKTRTSLPAAMCAVQA
jgi:hypothetical protein